MAKKFFTDESLETFISKTKEYTDAVAGSKVDASALDNYYTKTEIDNLELITVDDIDAICGATIQVTSLSDSEVTF